MLDQISRTARNRLSVVFMLVVLGGGFHVGKSMKFLDLSILSEDNKFGREVNALGAVIAGIAADQSGQRGNSIGTIDKPFFPDSPISVQLANGQITSSVGALLTLAEYSSNNGSGTVEKSVWNWNVTQNGPNTWTIERAGLKFNYTLELYLQNGVYHGVVKRPLERDWEIEGSVRAGSSNIQVTTGYVEPDFGIRLNPGT